MEAGKFVLFDLLINSYFWVTKLSIDFTLMFSYGIAWNTRFYRDVVAYAWDNIWEHGNGDNAHILANNDYKVQRRT